MLAGTNGEAVTLTQDEKAQLVKVTRDIAVEAGHPNLTIVLGCGGQCTRDVIAETKLAKDAGADFALVLVPSYFHFAMDEAAIIKFFQEVWEIFYQCKPVLTLPCSSLLMPAPFRFSSTASRGFQQD